MGAEIRLQHADRFFIGGKWVQPSSTRRFAVLDASTEQPFAQVAEALGPDIDQAVSAARDAFDRGDWPRLSPAERASFMRAIAAEVVARRDDLACIWAAESGVTLGYAEATIAASMSGLFGFYAALADRFEFEEEHARRTGGTGRLVREPVGVVAAIVPWNAPAGLLTAKCAPAFLAGCTVIAKASPEAPTSAYVLAEICEKVGLPPGVFNVVTADRAASEALVRHPGVDKVTFTGSTAAGRRIGSICGERVARCTLELGGKSPAIILDDCDVEQAAQAIARSAIYLTGQFCHSLTRLIVGRARHDRFVDALRAAFANVRVGNAFDASTQMGPLATGQQRERVETCIARGKAEGAALVAGGGRPDTGGRGFFVEPTIFARVDNAMAIARDEIFGPVLTVIPADDDDQAMRIANDSIYGLNASIFTADADRAEILARRLRCGTVSQNGAGVDFTIAFGGFKQSGIGREGGAEGLLPFLETKTLLLDATPP